MDTQVRQRMQAGLEAEHRRKGPPRDFPTLPDIPVGRYAEAEFLALERQRLWSRSWLYAGHLDELPEPGSYKLWQRIGVPILIVRDQSGNVQAFYNSCRHRGGPLVEQDSGTLGGGLVCRYHGWSYGLDGQLKGVRDRSDFVGLDATCRNLISLNCQLLGNWIFVNQDPQAPDLKTHLGPVYDYFDSLAILDLRLVHQQTYPVQCNYKMLLEGFLEVYHLHTLHDDTVHRFLDYRCNHIQLWPHGHSLMLTANRREDWVDPGARGMPEISGISDLERKSNPSFNLFPNLITPVAATALPFNLIWPVSDDSALLEVVWFAPNASNDDEQSSWDRRLENYERIIREDMVIIEQMQKSVNSPGFQGMPLSYQERRIYHWHEELDRRIGAERIPARLRVQPTLGPWVT